MLLSTALHALVANKLALWVFVPLLAVSSGFTAGVLFVPPTPGAAAEAHDATGPPAPAPLSPPAPVPPPDERGPNPASPCEPRAPNVTVERPAYVGWPVRFHLAAPPCLVGWTIDFGDGSAATPPNASAEHRYESRGTYLVRVESRFPNSTTYSYNERLTLSAYHPPIESGGGLGDRLYREPPLFPSENITYHWYLDNGLDWYNRPYSQTSWNVWKQGMENATYAHGQGGVTLHVLPLFDGALLTAGTPYAKAWIHKAEANPTNEIPPCQNGYVVDMPTYAITDLSPTLPSGWGFRSRVMGCGQDLFLPGQTRVGFCVEWDGDLLEGPRPYMDGYIADGCDLEMYREI